MVPSNALLNARTCDEQSLGKPRNGCAAGTYGVVQLSEIVREVVNRLHI